MRKLLLCAFAALVLMISLVVFPCRAWAHSDRVESEFETNYRVSTEVIENTPRSERLETRDRWRAWRGSNPRPLAPEANALSI